MVNNFKGIATKKKIIKMCKLTRGLIFVFLSSARLLSMGEPDPNKLRELWMAINEKDLNKVQTLLNENTSMVNMYFGDNCGKMHIGDKKYASAIGYTPLHFAVEKSTDKIVELLLTLEADSNAVVKSTDTFAGFTPLHIVAFLGGLRLQIAENLLKHKADINAVVKSGKFNGFTPLHIAINAGASHIVNLLLNRGAKKIPVKTDNGSSYEEGFYPIHLAIYIYAQTGWPFNEPAIKLFKSLDDDDNETFKITGNKNTKYNGLTPLMFAKCLNKENVKFKYAANRLFSIIIILILQSPKLTSIIGKIIENSDHKLLYALLHPNEEIYSVKNDWIDSIIGHVSDNKNLLAKAVEVYTSLKIKPDQLQAAELCVQVLVFHVLGGIGRLKALRLRSMWLINEFKNEKILLMKILLRYRRERIKMAWGSTKRNMRGYWNKIYYRFVSKYRDIEHYILEYLNPETKCPWDKK